MCMYIHVIHGCNIICAIAMGTKCRYVVEGCLGAVMLEFLVL